MCGYLVLVSGGGTPMISACSRQRTNCATTFPLTFPFLNFSMSSFNPEAIDLSHHLSQLSRARQTSPLKGLAKYLGQPGLLILAGGLPSPAYFPVADISANVLVSNSFPLGPTQESSSFAWFWRLFGADKEKTVPVTIPKYPVNPEDLNLATALQYGLSNGIPQLRKIVKEFSDKVFQPGYENYTVLLHAGNTDAWSKVVTTLCNPGEGVLVSKWSYPSAMATMHPFNIKPVPVDIDAQGMRSDALRTILTEWDEGVRGIPRPHVIYAVPIGENPTGTTTGLARKKEIYQICVEFGELILVEDDPYFVLQEGEYVPKAQRKQQSQSAVSGFDEESRFIASLEPSYLKIDYQGRVIRLDTFSKTIAPGCRLGWYTCNPMFAERLERAAETTTQAPCGFGQSLVTAALQEWKYEGYIRWLRGLRQQYTMRRDFFVDCLAEEFHLTVAHGTAGLWEGCVVYSGFAKPQRSLTGYFNEKAPLGNALFSFAPPTSGMFVWIKVHFDQHHASATRSSKDLETELFIELAEAGLVLAPGAMFWPTGDYASETTGHFRISFSNGTKEEFKKAVEIFGTVIRQFMANL